MPPSSYRFVCVCLLWLFAACKGGGGSSSTCSEEGCDVADASSDVPECVPTCTGTCGSDGCGGSCGSCGGSSVCNDGSCCQPASCQALDAQCGQVSAGCGMTINCGSCDQGGQCSNHQCLYGCGDGVLVEGEQCDDGNQEGGDGCEADCSFSCEADADCVDGDICSIETCNPVTHRCDSASLAEGSACGAGSCSAGQCLLSCASSVVDGGGAIALPSRQTDFGQTQVVLGQPGQPDLVLYADRRLLHLGHDNSMDTPTPLDFNPLQTNGPVYGGGSSLIRAGSSYYLAFCTESSNSSNVQRYAELVDGALVNELVVGATSSAVSGGGNSCFGVAADGYFADNQLLFRAGGIVGSFQYRLAPGNQVAAHVNNSDREYWGASSPKFKFESSQLKIGTGGVVYAAFDAEGSPLTGLGNAPGIVRRSVDRSLMVYQHAQELVAMVLSSTGGFGAYRVIEGAVGPFDFMQVLPHHQGEFPLLWLHEGMLHMALTSPGGISPVVVPINLTPEGGVTHFDADADADGISIVWDTAAGPFYQHLSWCD